MFQIAASIHKRQRIAPARMKCHGNKMPCHQGVNRRKQRRKEDFERINKKILL